MGTLTIDGGKLAVPQAAREGVRAFKGIPYAAPPVGDLRWRPPQPVVPWSGERAAETFGACSMQGVVFDDIDVSAEGISEDCLYLNVWTPAALESNGTERLPVMFWIHGGGFAVGSGSEPRYDGTNLAKQSVVVVTVNHRLNALGFLAHPELTKESAESASGNYGMLDLVAALAWVRRNIGAFGGDPDRVTIAGESAGSMAVSGLMASPLAKGLIHGAIGESGAMFASPDRRLDDLKRAEADGVRFAERLGASTLEELRRVPAEAILEAAPGVGYWPIADGYFLPRDPGEIFTAREHSDVPLMAGWNRDEGANGFNLRKRAAEGTLYADIVRTLFADHAETVLKHYPGDTPELAEDSCRALGGDLVISHATWRWLELQRNQGAGDVFRFRFDRAPLMPEGWFGDRPSSEAGAFHAGEILYVFDNLDAAPGLVTDADRTVAKLASGYWLNFIKTGNPNGPDLPAWPSYREGGDPIMVIDDPSRAESDGQRARYELLSEIANR